MAGIGEREPADFNQAGSLCPYLIARCGKKALTLSPIGLKADVRGSIANKLDTDPGVGVVEVRQRQLLKKATLTPLLGKSRLASGFKRG